MPGWRLAEPACWVACSVALLILSRPAWVAAEGTSPPSKLALPVAFTEAEAASNATDADKDAKVGKGWRAATVLDVAVHFDPAKHAAGTRFVVAGSTYLWTVTKVEPADGGKEVRYVLGPEPPPPPGGRWPSGVVAAIRLDAPIAFTRVRVSPDAKDAEKEEAIRGELGEGYHAAPLPRMREAFHCALPPDMEKFAAGGDTEAWCVRLRGKRLVLEGTGLAPDESEDVPLAAER